MKDYLSPGASIATIINAQMKDYTNKPITVSVGEENSTKYIKTVHPSCSSMYTLSPSEPRESIIYPYRSKNLCCNLPYPTLYKKCIFLGIIMAFYYKMFGLS